MTLSPVVPASVDQIMPLAEPIERFKLEPRCRVCRNDELRRKVNSLLASGASYAFIVRSLAEDNARLDPCDQVTVDSVRNHAGRHFPVQNVAQATYRAMATAPVHAPRALSSLRQCSRRRAMRSMDFLAASDARSVVIIQRDHFSHPSPQCEAPTSQLTTPPRRCELVRR